MLSNFHRMRGSGWPEATHVKETYLPGRTVFSGNVNLSEGDRSSQTQRKHADIINC